jgi:hypothetical protein
VTYRVADALITPELISDLYHVPPAAQQIFRIPQLHVIKVSFPRPVVQGSLHDRDMHAGQHHVPLANVVVPSAQSTITSKIELASDMCRSGCPEAWVGRDSRREDAP